MALTDFAGTFSQNFYYFFLPFIFVMAVFFGVLSLANIFNKKINLVISIIISLALAPTDFYPFITNYLLQFGAWITLIAFAVLFIFGVTFVSIGKGKEIYRKSLSLSDRLKEIDKQLKKLDDEILKARKRNDVKKEDKLWLERESLLRERFLVASQIAREIKLKRKI